MITSSIVVRQIAIMISILLSDELGAVPTTL